MIRVYTASKLTTAPYWRELEKQWPFVIFHARWLRHAEFGTPDTAEHAARFWQEDLEDAALAEVVLVYGKPGEHLRGALVEAGIALAAGVTVVVVGNHPDYGTWQYHPKVVRAADMEEAGEFLRRADEGLKKT